MERKEPTEEQKKLIKSQRLNPENWYVIWEDKDVLEILSKRRCSRRVIKKSK